MTPREMGEKIRRRQQAAQEILAGAWEHGMTLEHWTLLLDTQIAATWADGWNAAGQALEDMMTPLYADGEVIEYTSFNPSSGWSVGQVVHYAPDAEQTRVCPNCEQLAVPGRGQEDDFRDCARCLASVRFGALDPLVYIRSQSGRQPFPIRESQLRKRT